MRVRADGEETRGRILAAACEVFGERGYHQATFAEMGRQGEFNPALISFHFGSKDDLYRVVWQSLHRQVRQRWPADGGVPSQAPAEERLRAHVRSTLHLLCDPDLAALHRIDMQERVAATGLLEDEMHDHIRERRNHMRAVLRDLLGETATEEVVDLCEMSITNQLLVLRRPHRPGKQACGGKHRPGRRRSYLPRFTRDDVDRLTHHITRFSLGGVAAVRANLSDCS